MISVLLLVVAVLFVTFTSASNDKILIVNSNSNDQFKSLIIKDLSGQFKVEQINGNDKLPEIITVDDELPLFHTIYYLKSSSPEWSISQITTFVQNGGNFFTSAGNAKLFNELGWDLIEGRLSDPSNSKAQWNSQHSFSTLSKVLTVNIPESDSFTAFKLRNDPKLENFNPLIQNALSFAPGSSICPSKGGLCQSNSQSVSLLVTLESRKGSRFAAVSSLSLLSSLPESSLKGIFGWTRGSEFSFKIASVSHEMTNGKSVNRGRTELDSTIYRINDHINVRMCLTSGPDSRRFIPENVNDFQFELKMMNIQLRKSFDSVDSDGCLRSVNVQLPSKPAIYTLQIHHNRPGWSQLNHNERLLVRPFRHDEFPRFLRIAAPYYISWIGLLLASYFILLPSLFKQLK